MVSVHSFGGGLDAVTEMHSEEWRLLESYAVWLL
jgi:hypothetical protein